MLHSYVGRIQGPLCKQTSEKPGYPLALSEWVSVSPCLWGSRGQAHVIRPWCCPIHLAEFSQCKDRQEEPVAGFLGPWGVCSLLFPDSNKQQICSGNC